MKKIVLFMLVIVFFSLVMAENVTLTESNVSEVANCSEQLEICVEVYNNLLEDFSEGVNCGTATIQLKDANEYLAEERDTCLEELEWIKFYKVGFYIFFIMLIMIAVGFVFQAIKKKK